MLFTNMELHFKKIDWRQPPHEIKSNIESNFVLTKKAIELISSEIKSSHPKLKSIDDNIHIEPSLGISNVHGIKLNSKIQITSLTASTIHAKNINTEEILTQKIQSQNFNLSNDRMSIGEFHVNTENQSITIGGKEELRVSALKRTRMRIMPHKDEANYHSLLIQSQSNKPSKLDDENIHFVVKGNGAVGIKAFHNLKSTLTIGGDPSSQLTLKHPFTPNKNTLDKSQEGTIAWDNNFLYIKTSEGWKSILLENI